MDRLGRGGSCGCRLDRGGDRRCPSLLAPRGGQLLHQRPQPALVGHRYLEHGDVPVGQRAFRGVHPHLRPGRQLAVVGELDRLDALGGDRLGADVAADADYDHRRIEYAPLWRPAGGGRAEDLRPGLLLRVLGAADRIHHRFLRQDDRADRADGGMADSLDLRRHDGSIYDVRRADGRSSYGNPALHHPADRLHGVCLYCDGSTGWFVAHSGDDPRHTPRGVGARCRR